MAHSIAISEDYRVRVRGDAESFALLNGWERAPKGFTLCRLAGGRTPRYGMDELPLYIRGDRDPYRVLDHLDYFMLGRKPVAIVAMPYGAEMQHAREMADRYGLDVQAPPVEKSGWWLPGHSRCFAFIRPGVRVQWLPQQCSREERSGDDAE